MTEIATRASFLGGLKRRFGTIELPLSGMTVRYRSLSEAEMSSYEMAGWMRDDQGNLVRNEAAVSNARSRMIVLCVVDAEGNPLFTDADIPQIDLLDAADTIALAVRLRLHCGLDRPAEDAKKNASPNSETVPASDSSGG